MATDNQPSTILDLADTVRGRVLHTGRDGYDEALNGFQTGFRHRPAVLVSALGADDVQAAVRYAVAQDMAVAVQSTGHGITVRDQGGLLIKTDRMTGITVDLVARRARIEAGARWDQVVEKAAPHGLAPPSGSAGHVGVTGYTLAGGIGLLAREFGYAADHVHALDVVTSDGALRHVTADSDPDLFWALRGGRDNFGIVTSLEIGLQPVERIYGGGLFFDSAHAETVMSFFHEWTAQIPETMTASLGLIGYPPVPSIPEPLRGRHVVHLRFATTDLAIGPDLVRPWLGIAPVLLDHLGELPFREAGSIYREPNTANAYDGNGVLLSELNPAVLDAVRELAGANAQVGCIVDLRHLGGALSRQPAVPNAVSFREADYVLRVVSPIDGLQLADVRAVHKRLDDAVAPWTLGRSLNFLYGERAPEDFRAELYDKSVLERLTSLKAVYDPTNVFRRNQNIEPAV
ncbi:FAD-binding oxidoreductase [Streptomyces hygroscopicus]|uniref:FAD-binding oxidoreductase n=1 Tax=Streptomyces hygroscopicus TaxID=1912 RepID=UPI000826DEAE|nr:FAD-binding oxidoreductase [Streptomyces hygroscopicus]